MATEIRVAKKRRFTGAVVTITAGQDVEREVFYVHESILQERSGFFRAALSKEWKEGQDKKVELPDDTPDTVGSYVEWLFSGKIASSLKDAKVELTEADARAEHVFLAHLYVLGEKLLDDHFCDGVIKAMTELCNIKTATGLFQVPSRTGVKIIYQGTSANSPARLFLVDLYVQRARKDWMPQYKDGGSFHPVEFLFDLATAHLPQSRPPRTTDILVDPRWLKLKQK